MGRGLELIRVQEKPGAASGLTSSPAVERSPNTIRIFVVLCEWRQGTKSVLECDDVREGFESI